MILCLSRKWLGLATPGPGELSPKRIAEDGKDAFVADTSAASSRRERLHVRRGHADRADHEGRDQGVPLAPAERAVQTDVRYRSSVSLSAARLEAAVSELSEVFAQTLQGLWYSFACLGRTMTRVGLRFGPARLVGTHTP